MLWPVLAFAVIAAAFAVYGYRVATSTTYSPDERIGAIAPFGIAAFFAVAALAWLVGWLVVRAVGAGG